MLLDRQIQLLNPLFQLVDLVISTLLFLAPVLANLFLDFLYFFFSLFLLLFSSFLLLIPLLLKLLPPPLLLLISFPPQLRPKNLDFFVFLCLRRPQPLHLHITNLPPSTTLQLRVQLLQLRGLAVFFCAEFGVQVRDILL